MPPETQAMGNDMAAEPDSPTVADLEDLPLDEKNPLAAPKPPQTPEPEIEVRWDAARQCITGNFNPVLAVRLLQFALDPVTVAEREQFRKEHRELYWGELSEVERRALTEWAVCVVCGECTWCARRAHGRRVLCQHCFMDEGVDV